jgi:glycosyltransferase involved in cell wall biosynthesis
LFEHPGALEWMDDPWRDVARSGRFLQQLSARVAPDVVHLNGYVHGRLELGAPKLVVGHSCVLSWWQAVEQRSAPARYERYRACVQRGLRAAQLVAAPSAHMLRTLADIYGPLPRARVIANGCGPLPEPAVEKREIVFCAARLWDRAKNVETLARAARVLSWPVFVAGDGGAAAPLHGLGFLQPHELSEWYGRAAIYALPARYEPFGLSVLEAAQAACALVLGDIPSLREIWGDAAVYVPPDDAAGLQRELERLIADAPRRRELGRRARARAAGFSRRQMVDQYVDAYRTLRQLPASAAARGAA